MKKLPTSIENFKEMIKGNYYYVDKTMLIKDVLELAGKVKLITRPRRFGKTLNIDMMLRFFSMDEEENLFEGLKIWDEKEIVKEHYHKYPVIYISFKSVKESLWQDAYSRLRNEFAKMAKKYMDKIEDKESRRYLEVIVSKEGTKADYEDFLINLSEILYRETRVMPVILIDEYDLPRESAYLSKDKDPGYYENMIDFMRAFMTSALKGSDTYFSFVVLTGVYRIAKESIFSGLNNLAVYSVFHEGMDDKFGFTKDEVIKMLKYYNLTKQDKEIIERWYGGYIIGEQYNLYNPWSVINYIDSRINSKRPPIAHARKYWVNTSENALIKQHVIENEDVHKEILDLIEGKEINKTLDTSLSLVELEGNKMGVWVLFASAGYLSPRYNYESGEAENFYLKIPNEEIMRFFKETVIEWIRERTGIDSSDVVDRISDMMVNGEYEAFMKWLKEFLARGLSYYDVAKDENERFYKGFLLGLLSIAVNGYMVESEIESGLGRLDVVVFPKEKRYGKYSAIFEVKRADKEENLEKFAGKALEQIRERKYFAKMEALGYKVIGFGIAFCWKRVHIEVERLG